MEFLTKAEPGDFEAIEKAAFSGLIVGNFDLRAARQCAELFQKFQTDLNWRHIVPDKVKKKKDFMIVATAIAYNASSIVSEDRQLTSFAQGRIVVAGVPQAEVQTSFPELGSRSPVSAAN